MKMEEEEYQSSLSKKEKIASILQKIFSSVQIKEINDSELYRSELLRKLKFEKEHYPDLLRAGIDLLEDTESAIQDYFVVGLGNSNRLGEKYIRLYGLLNSVYQQIFAIVELITIFNYPRKREILQKLKELSIYTLRNKIGAHAINYQVGKEGNGLVNTDFFRVAQVTISEWGEGLMIIPYLGEAETVNLRQSLSDYVRYSDEVLVDVCKKVINSVFKNHGRKKEKLLSEINAI